MGGAGDYKIFLEQLKQEYARFHWRVGKKFAFRPPRTIIYEELSTEKSVPLHKEYVLRLLHELGHALCEHKSFMNDLERLKMEREAWERARELCKQYEIQYDEEFVEEQLDTYRDWLHQRSLCPRCGLTRYQTNRGEYHCLFCEECDIMA